MESRRVTKTLEDQWMVERQVREIYDYFYSIPPNSQSLILELQRDKHIDYLTRGLRKLAPSFSVLDANRPWVCYWTLHSIALLGESIDAKLENDAIDFLTRCQKQDYNHIILQPINPKHGRQQNKANLPTKSPPEKPPVPEAVVKRSIKEEPLALVKADLFAGDGTDSVKEGGGDGGGSRRRKGRPELSILRKAKRDEMVKKAALGFRIFGFLFCLVSFSVMAADRHKGWALDSFERYKEFRYCMSVNVIGFVYSGAQAFELAYQSATGKNLVQHHLRYMFDFSLDQVVTYLLISASSSAATRIDDWQSNWGRDKFPDMASASVAMSFLSFAALAFSSLISGYVLCKSRAT